MSRIHVLPPHVADLIAAGEVVERPAGAAKELLENAIDAGATAVTIELRRGGVAFLRVTDNGCGMNAGDARNAFRRHATSKIATQEDLSRIITLGFRGEALAAIAAVCRLELMTRERGAALGTALMLEAGELTDERDAGCPEGTTIVLRDLFYNVPARQKFLRRDATEAGHIQDAVVKCALAHPAISFRLIKDGAEALHTPGDGQLKSVIYSLFGREFGLSLLETVHTLDNVTVSGFIGKPDTARAGRSMQYYLVNGRPVRSRTLYAALEEGYKNALPAGRSPVCVLHVALPPDCYDINIHPAKAEIKFAADRAVFDCVYFAVKTALREREAQPQLRIPALPKPEPEPNMPQLTFTPPTPSVGADGNPPAAPPPTTPQSAEQSAPPPSDTGGLTPPLQPVPPPAGRPMVMREEFAPYQTGGATPSAPAIPANIAEDTGVDLSWRLIGQALDGYLLAESADALWLIDKHAAHERILYDRLRQDGHEPMSQMLLTPLTAALPARHCQALLREEGLLYRAGFQLEDFGGLLLVRAVPDFVTPDEAPALLSELAEQLLAGTRSPGLRDEVYHTVACKAAVKLTTRSHPDDLLALTRRVMEDPNLRHCPHGRPVAIRLTRSQLERQFLR